MKEEMTEFLKLLRGSTEVAIEKMPAIVQAFAEYAFYSSIPWVILSLLLAATFGCLSWLNYRLYKKTEDDGYMIGAFLLGAIMFFSLAFSAGTINRMLHSKLSPATLFYKKVIKKEVK